MMKFSRTTRIHVLLGIFVGAVALLMPRDRALGDEPSELVVGEVYEGPVMYCPTREGANALAEVVATERAAPADEVTFCNHSAIRFRVVGLVKPHAKNGNVANVIEARSSRTGETFYIISDMSVVARRTRT